VKISLPLMQQAKKKNAKYLLNLSTGLKRLPKSVLAAISANALHMIILRTVHDSSRFAANWDLSLAAGGTRSGLDPAEYGQSGPSYGAVGQRGDARRHKDAVLHAKAMYYGYIIEGEKVRVVEQGRIHSQLGVGRPGRAPTVHLYNPIIGAMPRYTANAMGGETVSISPGLRMTLLYEAGKQAAGFELTKLFRRLRQL